MRSPDDWSYEEWMAAQSNERSPMTGDRDICRCGHQRIDHESDGNKEGSCMEQNHITSLDCKCEKFELKEIEK